MQLQLTDAEVKDAIMDWLENRIDLPADLSQVKIRRLFYNEGSDYQTVVEMPDAIQPREA